MNKIAEIKKIQSDVFNKKVETIYNILKRHNLDYDNLSEELKIVIIELYDYACINILEKLFNERKK